MSAETLTRIAAAMGCAPADDDDLVEAVRLLVAERDGARAELEATERARQAAEEERDTVLELVADDAVEAARQRDDRDAARLAALATVRVALADAELILEERERQLTAALTAVAEERTRREAAEASATRSADAAVDAARELGHVAAAAVARADAAEAEVVRLRVYLSDATDDAVGLVERVHRAVETHQGVVRERDAARALTDGLRVELAAALTAVAAERARCAAVCREVAARYRSGACGCAECEGRGDGARECAEAIERGEAGQCTPHSSRGNT